MNSPENTGDKNFATSPERERSLATNNNNETATQLADVRPQIDSPIRVLIPLSVNAPHRAERLNRDQYIRANAFSPSAFAVMKAMVQPANASGKKFLPQANRLEADQDAQLQTAIRDYTVLAFSSRRAGKREVEASAYVSIAVIQDNQGNYQQVRKGLLSAYSFA